MSKWIYNKENIEKIVSDFSLNYELKLIGDSNNLSDIKNCDIINIDKGKRIAQFLKLEIINSIPIIHITNIPINIQTKFEAYISNFALVGFPFKIIYYGILNTKL